ncbi:MAG: helix-turn-helix transcriptional regulator [Mycobacterium sp.]|jgi:excisionase family DNA binding protein
MNDGITFPRLLTAKNIAEILCVPVSTVHHWAGRGEGPPSFKVGKHRRYDAAAVLRWIEQTKGTAA